MAYIRKQIRGAQTYYYLVKSEREGAKVKQRVLKYMGKVQPNREEVERIIKSIIIRKEGK